MPRYSVVLPADLLLCVKADNARGALTASCEAVAQWTGADSPWRMVDGIRVIPGEPLDPLFAGKVVVENCEDKRDHRTFAATEDAATKLQAGLLEFLAGAKRVGTTIPSELLRLAEALIEPLQTHLLTSSQLARLPRSSKLTIAE